MDEKEIERVVSERAPSPKPGDAPRTSAADEQDDAPVIRPALGLRAVVTSRGGASVRVRVCELIPRPDGSNEWRTYGVLQMPTAAWLAFREALRRGCASIGATLAERSD